jgi:hypothetical protein
MIDPYAVSEQDRYREIIAQLPCLSGYRAMVGTLRHWTREAAIVRCGYSWYSLPWERVEWRLHD